VHSRPAWLKRVSPTTTAFPHFFPHSFSWREFAAVNAIPSSLKTIVKYELLEKETAEKIRVIWIQYFSNKDGVIAAVLEPDTFSTIAKRAKECPLFVFPFPRADGFVSIVSEMRPQANVCAFTSLDEYKKHGADAKPLATMNYYTEFMNSKQLVLMKGDYDSEFFKTTDVQYLVNVWQIFLLEDSKFELMRSFNSRPQDFNFVAVIKEMESLPRLSTYEMPEPPEKTPIPGS